LSKSILLVTHVPVRLTSAGALIDEQTARGIKQWCRYFNKVTYIGIEEISPARVSSSTWVNLAEQPEAQRCALSALPNAYRIADMMRSLGAVRKLLRREIANHDLLCFTIGGLVGDWPAIAALGAIAQKRNYVAWIDRVEVEVIRRTLRGASLKRRLKYAAMLPLMGQYQRFILSRSETALLQGMDTFQHFNTSASNPHCIYDTHTTLADRINPVKLAEKQASIKAGGPLKIVYAGRAAAMKGTDHWLDVLTLLAERGVPFRARWIGDGPELQAMQLRVENTLLREKVVLSGFEPNHQVLLKALHESDMLLFCHKTAESPRCLIEALVCGCPLVGYESAYVSGMVHPAGGAALSRRNQVEALADMVEDLHQNRHRLADLVAAAAISGMRYDEDTVYQHRAKLMGAS
jgi:glycosyltransferase involved in cell wall biosynthesis